MAMPTPYPRLFSPLQLGGLALRNRVVHASLSTRLGRPGGVRTAYLAYCEIRARSGARMLITEPVRLLPEQGAARLPTGSADNLAELHAYAAAPARCLCGFRRT